MARDGDAAGSELGLVDEGPAVALLLCQQLSQRPGEGIPLPSGLLPFTSGMALAGHHPGKVISPPLSALLSQADRAPALRSDRREGPAWEAQRELRDR